MDPPLRPHPPLRLPEFQPDLRLHQHGTIQLKWVVASRSRLLYCGQPVTRYWPATWFRPSSLGVWCAELLLCRQSAYTSEDWMWNGPDNIT